MQDTRRNFLLGPFGDLLSIQENEGSVLNPACDISKDRTDSPGGQSNWISLTRGNNSTIFLQESNFLRKVGANPIFHIRLGNAPGLLLTPKPAETWGSEAGQGMCRENLYFHTTSWLHDSFSGTTIYAPSFPPSASFPFPPFFCVSPNQRTLRPLGPNAEWEETDHL